MSLLLVAIITILSVLLGKILFEKWFNHLALYALIWGGMIELYEWRLLPYFDITLFTWFIIIGAFLSFLFGILTIISAKKLYNVKIQTTINPVADILLFQDKGTTLKYALLVFSLISVFSGIHHWYVLIKMFGSIPAVFVNATVIYRLNVEREIKGFIPYLPIFGYVAIFFSAIFTAYKGKFSILTFLPFIGIILKELATVGRAGMLLALLEFTFTFYFTKKLLGSNSLTKYKFSKKNAVFSLTILASLFIISASLVKVSRISGENYSGASRTLKQLKGNMIITPSIYLYLSCDLGTLNEYLKTPREATGFGHHSFLPFYDFLAKFGVVEKVPDVQKGYFIPMWANTGTYLREIHADFGIIGVFVIPFSLGLVITWLWFRLDKRKSIVSLALLVYLNLIVGFSFLLMVTRVTYWSTSLLIIIVSIPIIERIAIYEGKK